MKSSLFLLSTEVDLRFFSHLHMSSLLRYTIILLCRPRPLQCHNIITVLHLHSVYNAEALCENTSMCSLLSMDNNSDSEGLPPLIQERTCMYDSHLCLRKMKFLPQCQMDTTHVRLCALRAAINPESFNRYCNC